MNAFPALAPAAGQWHVICLCAQWCGACRDWLPQLRALAAAHPLVRFHWVDIEDQADAVGELEVETFPTLLIADGEDARFLGPVSPQPQQVSRLLQTLREDSLAGHADAAAQALLRRLDVSKLVSL